MNRRSLSCNWTEEDRLTCARWRRGMAVLYGCVAFLVFGLIVLTKQPNVAPNDTRDRQTWSAGRQSEPMERDAQMSGKTR